MGKTHNERISQRKREGRQCSACGASAYRLSQYCKAHWERNKRYGHPRGEPLFKGALRPYRKRAKRFLHEYRDHKAILAAVEWLDQLIYGERRVPRRVTRCSTNDEKLGYHLRRMKDAEVSPYDVMELILAIYLYREENPRFFKSDRHFDHILALHCLRLAKGRRKTVREGYRETYERVIGMQVRDLFARITRESLGVVALQAVPLIRAMDPLPRIQPKAEIWTPLRPPDAEKDNGQNLQKSGTV